MFETNGPVPQILLSIAAIVSLSLGLFQDFGQPRPEGRSYSVTAVTVGSKAESASNFTRNFGWANHKDTRNGTNLIPISSDLKAILYSKSASEVVTPRYMQDVVVFHGARGTQSTQGRLRDRRRQYHGTTPREPEPTSRRASPEGNSLAFPDVVRQVSNRGQTARETETTTARGVNREIRDQPIIPRQQSIAEIDPRDPSDGMSSPAPSPNSFVDDNTIVGNSPPYREGLPAAVARCGSLSRFVLLLFILLILFSRLPSPLSLTSLLSFFKAHYRAP